MKKLFSFVFMVAIMVLPFAVQAQIIAAPPSWDFTTPTTSFNTLYYVVFGLLTVVVGQLAKYSKIFSAIPQTFLKVAAAAVPVVFIALHFGLSATVLSSIYGAVISLFFGAGMYSGVQSLKN